MATASTTAWVLHDLGLAAGFGGSLFGKLALGPAVEAVESKVERGRVLEKAWSGFQGVQIASLATMAGTWLVGRSLVSGRSAGRDVRHLVVTKDALVGTAVVTGIVTSIVGAMLSHEHAKQNGVPMISGGKPAAETPPRAAFLQRVVNVLGDVNLAVLAGVLGVTTVLAMKSGESSRWAVISRLLP
jgi:hypothetical protein